VNPRLEPPRLARRLLARSLPDDARDDVDGDLLEVYARHCAHHGVTRARLWYCTQAVSFSARFLAERLRQRDVSVERIDVNPLRCRAMPSSLDVRLAARMLVKYPGLSVVSVTGMAVAIAIGTVVFSILAALLETKVPLPDGQRLVALSNAIATKPGTNESSLLDFETWRGRLGSFQDVAAFTTVQRNLLIPETPVELVRVVRMTASGFGIARTSPLMGRPLLDEDDRSNARVLVIGYDEWQYRFAADPAVVGRFVRLGNEDYTVVGVMPKGFRFPVDDGYWLPLAFEPAERERSAAIPVTIVGRLAEGATIQSAEAEMATVGARMAAEYPATHEGLRPQVRWYTRAFFDIENPGTVPEAQYFLLFISLLLVVVAVNVAILVYARTATRAGEIAVRTALGATRARVVTQLFVEALALCVAAALMGLAIAGLTLHTLQAIAERQLGELPFWVDLALSPAVVAYALALAVVGAVIVGVLPALKATGRRVQQRLQQLSGHGAQMQLGRAWTGLIIAQVAVAVAVLPFALHFTEEAVGEAVADVGYPAAEFLEASLTMERLGARCPRIGFCDQFSGDTIVVPDRALEQHFRDRAAELIRRIESEPAVAGLSIRIRGAERVEIEGIPLGGADRRISVGTKPVDRVGASFFALYAMPVLAGRSFVAGDARSGATAVIVNQLFAERHLDGGALGRRLRFLRESKIAGEVDAGPWLEVVGVVRDFEEHSYEPSGRLYLPTDVAQLAPPIGLAIRMRAHPAATVMPRVRELVTIVDPRLQLDGLNTAADRHRQNRRLSRYLGVGTAIAMLSVLLLSAAGIYAMMAFTVARRRREIGIRSALGADAQRVLRSVFARASAQVSAGIVLGLLGTVALDRLTGRGPINDGNLTALLLVAVVMMTVGVIAAIGPARRGLAVQPTEALRAD
jgi:putative ABC transport system permease protein